MLGKRPLPDFYESANPHLADNFQKENISPKHIFKNSDVTSIATPKKSRTFEDPVTPNTNFKLLTSLAATLDYANCSTPKSHKNYGSSSDQTLSDNDLSLSKGHRKEKSLAIICSKFLAMYPLNPPPEEKVIVSLDDVCMKLGVERRRLYDIVNVFESIDILTRNAKNQYLWFGKNNLLKSLQKLKALAVKEKILEKLQYVLSSECSVNCKQSCMVNDIENFNKISTLEEISPNVPHSTKVQREKSLGIMSQKFLMLFLVSPSQIISIGVAAKVLNGLSLKNDRCAQVKTQIRRLYDVANVLSSIGLIQKEVAFLNHGRKPAFKYIGPILESDYPCKEDFMLYHARKNDKSRIISRHSSFQDICTVATMERQKLKLNESNSAPPFENKISGESRTIQTSFTNLCVKNEPKVKTGSTNKPVIKTLQVQLQSNVKVLNITKPSNSSVPLYLLNSLPSSISEAKYGCQDTAQTFYLINSVGPVKEVKPNIQANENIDNRTIFLTSDQRDTILQSLNISLSSEQVASILLDGASTPPGSSSLSYNVVKIIDKNDGSLLSENSCLKESSKVIEHTKNATDSSCDTEQFTPSSISPFSLPSGYVTPIPTMTADMQFASNSEISNVLKSIENPSEFGDHSGLALNSDKNRILNSENSIKSEDNVVLNIKEKYSNYENASFPSLQDSNSNDSLNLEVTNIMKKNTDNVIRNKSFLIDEKTLLSPVKKSALVYSSKAAVSTASVLPNNFILINTPRISSQTFTVVTKPIFH